MSYTRHIEIISHAQTEHLMPILSPLHLWEMKKKETEQQSEGETV